jgi:hypothetical protein
MGEIINLIRTSDLSVAPQYSSIEKLLLKMQDRKVHLCQVFYVNLNFNLFYFSLQNEGTSMKKSVTKSSTKRSYVEKSENPPKPVENLKSAQIESYADFSNSSGTLSKTSKREILKPIQPSTKDFTKETSSSKFYGGMEEYSENVPVQSSIIKSPLRRSNRLSNDSDAPFSGLMKLASSAFKPLDQASSLKRSKSSMGSFHIIEGPHKGETFSIHDFIKSTKDVAVLGRGDRFGVMSLNRDDYVSES